jgi:hypothetical protein
MEAEIFSETRIEATKKWKQYIAAAKKTDLPIYKDLAKVYNMVKGGRKIIDIHQTIAKGGVHRETHQPRLAIARADNEFVWCQYTESGYVTFTNGASNWDDQARAPIKEDIVLSDCLPRFSCKALIESGKMDKKYLDQRRMELKAPVPMISPHLLPKKLTKDYYILWEVDEWKIVPPTDPWLLRRITKTMFVVCAAWDLTKLEKAVMRSRLI